MCERNRVEGAVRVKPPWLNAILSERGGEHHIEPFTYSNLREGKSGVYFLTKGQCYETFRRLFSRLFRLLFWYLFCFYLDAY